MAARNGAVIAAWNFFVDGKRNSVIDLVMAANHPDVSLACFASVDLARLCGHQYRR
jgi:hypothetical protein